MVTIVMTSATRSGRWASAAVMRAAAVAMLLTLAGCASGGGGATTRPATDLDPRLATPEHWYAQPATAVVSHGDFDTLWSAADDAARGRFFVPDRVDRRAGVFLTEPMVSRQWFEPWRADTRTGFDLAESSLATVRRTVRFEIARREDGGFALTPKVLVERYAVAENRVTSVVLYRSAFRLGRITETTPRGTRESDRGVYLPARYWYAIGRDSALEQALANDVQRRLARSS